MQDGEQVGYSDRAVPVHVVEEVPVEDSDVLASGEQVGTDRVA